MKYISRAAKKIPGVPQLYRGAVRILDYFRLRFLPPDRIFLHIYKKNTWGGSESVSGPGSDRAQTSVLEARLPGLFRELGVKSILDIPCGDFHWMKNVDLGSVSYIGADIVKELVDLNRSRYGNDAIKFMHLNLLEDPLPTADLVFCRDCLVHLANRDALAALRNIAESGSKYLLTTTFPTRINTSDIATGQWRPINLTKEPFSLPEPMLIINEECTEAHGRFRDKSIALLSIDAIRKRLAA